MLALGIILFILCLLFLLVLVWRDFTKEQRERLLNKDKSDAN